MAHVWADRVAETTTTIGTGALALSAITGFQRFSAVCSVSDTVIYALEAVDANGVPTGDWETGIGTYSSANTLTRTTVLKSSNSNSVVTLAAGTKNVFLDDIASTRNTLQEYTGAQSTNQPSAPVSGSILWSQDHNGWPVAMQRGVNGISLPLNPLLPGRWGLAVVSPTDSSSVTTLGCLATVVNGSILGADVTTAYGSTTLLGLTTTATASTAGSLRTTTAVIPFRATPSAGGFHLAMVWGLNTIGNTNCRWFCGVVASSAALAATFDPASTTGSNFVGVGASGADTTNAKLYWSAGSAANSVDLGASFTAKTAKAGVYCLELWGAGGSATSISYRVWRMDDLTVAPVSGTISTTLPAAQAMYAHWQINNNATATASTMAAGVGYFERGV